MFMATGRSLGSALRRRARRAGRWGVEALEARALLTAWFDEGPGLITGGQAQGLTNPNNPVVGAVKAIAPDLANVNVLYAGTVDGGVWKTSNATAPINKIQWAPLTDNLPSLAISDVAISPHSENLIVAGTGDYSAGYVGLSRAPLDTSGAGVYISTDAGQTWTVTGAAAFGTRRIGNVVPTDQNEGQTIFAALPDTSAGNDGVWRTTDLGATWKRLSGANGLDTGGVSSLVGDPSKPARFFAAIPGKGVYRTDDTGDTWTKINTGIDAAQITGSQRILMAVQMNPKHSNFAVYAALLDATKLTGLYRSGDGGKTWLSLNLPSDADGPLMNSTQSKLDFAIAADAEVSNVVYVSGVTALKIPAANGATTYTDRAFRGLLQDGTMRWETIDVKGAGGTSPHADSRDMKFDANFNLIQANDGGVYKLIDRISATKRKWTSLMGTLPQTGGPRPTELYTVSYDNLTRVLVGAAQDVGAADQSGYGSRTWTEINQGDGGVAAAGVTTDRTASYHYTSSQGLSNFTRRKFDATGKLINTATPALTVVGTGKTIIQLDGPTGTRTLLSQPPMALDRFDPLRVVIGTNYLYESSDGGATFNRRDGGGDIGQISTFAYGANNSDGTPNPDVLYVGTTGRKKDGSAAPRITLRSVKDGAFNFVPFPGAAADYPRSIAVDPRDWTRVYMVDSGNHVWASFDAGQHWSNVTGNLNTLQSPTVRDESIEIISTKPGVLDDILVVGGFGGVFGIRHPGLGGAPSNWTKLGTGLPEVQVSDVHYDARSNFLIVATFGRGAMSLVNPNSTLPPDPPRRGATVGPSLAAGSATVAVPAAATAARPSDRLVAPVVVASRPRGPRVAASHWTASRPRVAARPIADAVRVSPGGALFAS